MLAVVLSAVGCGGDDAGGGDTAKGTEHFFLPTGEPDNTTNPTVETDAAGNVHMVYPAYAGGDAYYATCSGNCTDEKQVKVVTLPTQGTVANAMLALGPDGKPRVLLSTFSRVYYGVCTGDCTVASGWSLDVILEHGSKQEVSGEAFALTRDGRPRFLLHTYRAYLGIGQEAPETYFAQCDANCASPSGWQYGRIAEQIWEEASLRLDAQDRPRIATVARVGTEGGTVLMGAYVACDADCLKEASWSPVALQNAYADPYVAEIDAAVSLALTGTGAPRVLLLAKDPQGVKSLVYAECDAACTADSSWRGGFINQSDKIGAGLDLALDAQGRPRFVYTADGNILLGHCDKDCAGASADWKLTQVELGADMPPDDIFLYPNCNVGAWFLRHPSLALGKDGLPRVAYRAEDISGGWSNPEPTQPGCQAGADMTLARFAQLSSLD
ncbi:MULTISPECIES: hypothetical protein [Myxococcaceae]|uniref:hypothetical protein n=1 Tax=Myxococcaceae TaxID=31 RepID=UPI00129D118D|nr:MULTISPECIES: hypothetical protein [Myxococcaceae]MBF5044997.1 hypothetical protein [Simulacricoccus sp. 17bor-14]